MARSTAEIQAEIAVTRRLIEKQLDAVRRRLPDRWWTPYAVLAGALPDPVSFPACTRLRGCRPMRSPRKASA